MAIVQNSVLIYVDILPEQPSQLMVPYGFTDVVSWLSYRAYKKIMSIRPFGPQEVRILLKRQRERLERQRAGSIVDVDLTGGSITFDSQATVSMSPPGSVHSTPTSTKRRTLHLRDRSNSVGSPQQQRDRANSMASELGMSPTRSARPLNPKALAGKPFSVEVPLQQGTKLLIRRIAQELQVDAAHLALFIVNVTSIYAEDWEGDKWEASPISLACDFAHLKLLETLKKLNLNFKQNAKYCVFYQILPFPLVDNRGLDQRSKYKFTDYLIVDERIRYWRSLFLEHLCTTTSSSSSTAGAASGVAAGAVGADITTIADAEQSTPKRSRTNSEGHSDAAVERSNSNTIASGASGKLQHLQPAPPREAAIRWPQPNRPPSEYDIPEVGRVSVMIPATYTMREVTSHLRYEIGIPANFRELDALKYADAPAARAQQQEEIVRILLMPNVGPSVISGTNKATCTDDLKITSDGAVKPSFPLLATVIRNNVINEILTGGKTMFIACRWVTVLFVILCETLLSGLNLLCMNPRVCIYLLFGVVFYS